MEESMVHSLSIDENTQTSVDRFQLLHSMTNNDNSVTADTQDLYIPSPFSPFSSQKEQQSQQHEDIVTNGKKISTKEEQQQMSTQISEFTTDNSQVDPIIEDDDNMSLPSIPSISNNEKEKQQTEELPQLKFHFRDRIPSVLPQTLASTPKIIVPQCSSVANVNKLDQPLFCPDGLVDNTLKCILKKKTEFEQWENTVNAHMAKYGSIAKVSRYDQDAVLFRMLNTWTEGGLVFSRCVLLPQEDIDFLLSFASAPSSMQEGSQIQQHLQQQRTLTSFGSNTQVESIKEFESQITPRLPEYVPKEGAEDETFLFAFSFAYMRYPPPPHILNKFVEEEQVVGVWPDWKEINMEIEGMGTFEVNLVTKFKADSIY
ncbi:hypothetical protein BDF20DRAFT_355658 [Mycotypha africana]|uniref:uncharacterized protein n=1 Tax=Mycotypha africana TaxID=64632 RepID=UPI0023007D62|nr:uncharacterized protein BDF20DRAFT_355658 [Mycotypha africana]KAI8983942.1 hypothetical protein BDF20DRAFT_355658 [Mycotypha africana]